jgi:hypothetical protein
MSDEQPIEEYEKRAVLFDQMAAQIRLNKDAKFGGAFLMVPPTGEPFSSLMLNQEEPSIFWAAVQTLAKVALDALEKLQRQGFR